MKERLFHVIIKSIGETIFGKTVKLVASNDVSLQAATNTSEKLENAKSKGWSVGANISVAGGGILGFDASANAAKQKSNTKVTTHTGTSVVGLDAVAITSGKDTHISGSKVVGTSVTADVGGNLSIESLQDTKTYVGESSNKGFSVSTNAGSLSNVSMSSSNGKMKSDYASVTDQAGIYAGDGGFVINTAETTSLTGAVIDSAADSNKNKLSTKSLDVKDIENTAEYTSRNIGMSYNHVGDFKNLSKAGKDAVWNTLGTLPNLLPDSSKSSSSTKKSAISNGTIEVRDADFNMQTLSRDTKDSLNKLDEIFDKKKIEERQELSKLFAKEAFGQLHNWNPTSKEGKAAKAIAHGVVAEVSARMAGNKPGSGFYAGATNEALIGEIQNIAKTNPAVAQWLSAGVGAMVNAASNQSSVTGAMVAQTGTQENAYGRMRQPDELGEFEYYYFIDLYGNTYKRTKHKDILINPSEVNVLLVVQNSEKGHQLGGQEVIINSDRSWTAIDEPLGYVYPDGMFKTNWWRESKSDGERAEEFVKTIDSLEQQLNQPYVVDTWPDKTTGLVYNQYNDGHVEFTGKYQGNLNALAGMPVVLDPKKEYFLSGNYAIYDDGTPEINNILNIAKMNMAMDEVINAPGMMFANGDMGRIKSSVFTGLAPIKFESFKPIRKNNIINEYDYDPFRTEKLLYPISVKGYSQISSIFDENKPKNWTMYNTRWNRPNEPGFIQLKDANGNVRYRADPPDKFTKVEHLHIYDKYGSSLDEFYNPVDRKSPDAHISIKQGENSISMQEYKKKKKE
ncbi:MAG: hemagglutinin repeat-containing protein [Veillonella caviae]|uniref:hemagglutinin repeat-containing protein n=1 Tax=Veillonella caviae TaxID=248316 RepID=UPI002A910D3D|nr:hemagglutinin repeat-containing protein [Veillonella caviae]MDY5715226.1 hemagglutinin repeat-containing protein [Veillonella caviae]